MSLSEDERSKAKEDRKVMTLVTLIASLSFIVSVLCLLLIPEESDFRYPMTLVFFAVTILLMIRYSCKMGICGMPLVNPEEDDPENGENSRVSQIEIVVQRGMRVLSVRHLNEEATSVERTRERPPQRSTPRSENAGSECANASQDEGTIQ